VERDRDFDRQEMADLRKAATTTKPVRVRFDCTAEDLGREWMNVANVGRDIWEWTLDYLAARAVIDVPEGVPSVEEIRAAWKAGGEPVAFGVIDFTRDYLAPWLTPRQPVDVEALAKAICRGDAHDEPHEDSWITTLPLDQDAYRHMARAAIAHLGLEAEA